MVMQANMFCRKREREIVGQEGLEYHQIART
jgi:hypothetical protein